MSPGRSEALRVVVLGYIVRFPLGGMAWHYLQYALGLARLGHDVYFIEDSEDEPYCYNPVTGVVDADPVHGLAFAESAFRQVGLAQKWAYHDAPSSRWLGPLGERAREICATADLLLDVSGVNTIRPWLLDIPVRALIDTEPVFTQWRIDGGRLDVQHNAFFSFGENTERWRSLVPEDHRPWHPTRQPIVLDMWPVTPAPGDGPFTTVMQWESHPPRSYRGVRYGMKAESFPPYMDLPSNVKPVLELAVAGRAEALGELGSHGWVLKDPVSVTRDLWEYRRYVQGSRAEFTVSKEGFVVSRCGWFSERSACYLAAGRPVISQDTGFTDWLPAGRGVIGFDSPEEAAEAIGEVDARYDMHSSAAREIAEEYFDARKVLKALLERATTPIASGRPA